MKEWLFRTALASKIRAYREGRINNNTIWDKLIFDKVRNNLGGSIRLIATGSAMLDPHVGEVLRSILGCQVNILFILNTIIYTIISFRW